MSGVGRAQLLRMEAEVVELQEAFDKLKADRPRCESCNRLEVVRGKSKLEKKIQDAGVVLHEKRKAWREARVASDT